MSGAYITDAATAAQISPDGAKPIIEATDKITDVVLALGERVGVGHAIEGLATVLLRFGLVAKEMGVDTTGLCRMTRLIADAIEHSEPEGRA